MSKVIIAALPRQDEYVWNVSSEKIPHMTLLFLGEDGTKIKNMDKIIDFVEHASKLSMCFELDVDRRGELGQDSADVLFFSKTKWSGFESINNFRSNLLKEHNIRTAYDSIEQFPEWVPHLTLGYPETPAKPDTRDYPGIRWVYFDRIAVWYSGDYEGIEFPLKKYGWNETATMSGTKIVDNILTHYGVRGMKWGVRRKATVGPQEVIIRDNRKKIKTSGGAGYPASADALRTRRLGQIGKKSGLKALSDQELRDYSNRLQLEQSVKRLNYNEMNRGKKFVATILGKSGNQLASEGVNKGTKEVGKKAVKLVFT